MYDVSDDVAERVDVGNVRCGHDMDEDIIDIVTCFVQVDGLEIEWKRHLYVANRDGRGWVVAIGCAAWAGMHIDRRMSLEACTRSDKP